MSPAFPLFSNTKLQNEIKVRWPRTRAKSL